MIRRRHVKRKTRKSTLNTLTIVVTIIFIVTLACHYVFFAKGKLELTVTPRQEPYSASRYAIFDLEVKNTSRQDIASAFGTCAEERIISIDDVQVYPDHSGVTCAIGYGDVEAGDKRKDTLKLSLRGLKPGLHTLRVASGTAGEMSSDRITFRLDTGELYPCYGFINYELTHCDQITISNGAGTYGDSKAAAMKRCRVALQKYFTKTAYRPIENIGTSDCSWWNTQLVFNVPPQDTRNLLNELLLKKGFRTNIHVTQYAARDAKSFSENWLHYVGE